MCGVIGQKQPTEIMPKTGQRAAIGAKRPPIFLSSIKGETPRVHAMPSRKDATSKRFLALVRQKKENSSLLKPLNMGLDAETLSRLDDPIVHSALSHTALTFDEAIPGSTAILRAFKATGLDPRNPFDWRKLLECFAEAHFGKKKTKRITWNSWKFSALLKDYLNVKQGRHELSDYEVCELLKKDKIHKVKYGDYNIHALRKLVRCARSPEYNLDLRYPEMSDPILREIRSHFERRNEPWDEMVGMKLADVLKQLMEVDSTGELVWRQHGTTKGQTSK
jgi:hypothetical protein